MPMNMIAATIVIFASSVVAPRGPNAPPLMPPPNAEAMSPFPGCRSTTRIRMTHEMTKTVYTIYAITTTLPFGLPFSYVYFTILAKLSASRLAPPTSPPSMSGWLISSAMFSGLTLPP